jgi:hypothetical protein
MLVSEWLPILTSHETKLLNEVGLHGFTFVHNGGPFGNTLEFRHGAQWLVLEAIHPTGTKKAVRVPVHDRFAQDDHIQRLRLVAEKLDEQRANWFPAFEIYFYDFGGDVQLKPCPVVVMDWIAGETYASALWKQRNNPKELRALNSQLSQLIEVMKQGGFDHGDVSVSNLRVMPNGMMMLLDPDSLIHESMSLSQNLELGHPTWNHPKRSTAHTKHLHVIPYELMKWFNRGLQADPTLLTETPDLEEFYFTEQDLANPYESERFERLVNALHISNSMPEGKSIFNLMNALCDDFEHLGNYVELPPPTEVQPSVTIEYLLSLRAIPRPKNKQNVVKPRKKLLKPTPFFKEFNRFSKE